MGRAVCLLSLVVAAVLVLRWFLTRTDALGRRRDFPVIATVLALAVAAPSGIPAARHARLEHTLSTVASSLAGAPVRVRCETLAQAWTQASPEAGYVRFDPSGRPEPLATITVDACRDLRRWLGSDRADPDLAEVIAVHVLTHEAMHLAGTIDEAEAECAAVRLDARTAQLLGATADQAARLAATYWQQVYPRLPDAYRSAGCTPLAA